MMYGRSLKSFSCIWLTICLRWLTSTARSCCVYMSSYVLSQYPVSLLLPYWLQSRTDRIEEGSTPGIQSHMARSKLRYL